MTFPSAAAELARVRAGEISVREAISARLKQLRQCDDRTSAVASFEDEHVLREADRLDARFVDDRDAIGPLHGLAITVKDWIDVQGFRCAGVSDDSDRRPPADATVVRRLRAAGAIVVAKTKAWGPAAPAEGYVRHPTHDERMPGGSSTGEAVVVAAGASLVGVGSDSGGSIRLPASWCGVVGVKPTAGLIPLTGHYPRVGERHDGRTQIGPIARSVDDAALLLAVMARRDEDISTPPVAIDWTGVDVTAGLTFAVVTDEPDHALSDAEVRGAVQSAAARLEEAGLRRVEWSEPWLSDGLEITRQYWTRTSRTGAEIDQHLRDWDTFRFRYLRGSAHVDVLLTPSTPTPAPLREVIGEEQYRFTVPASLTGSPAIAVPFGAAANGLPLSVQLIGRPWDDRRVLAVARLLERS